MKRKICRKLGGIAMGLALGAVCCDGRPARIAAVTLLFMAAGMLLLYLGGGLTPGQKESARACAKDSDAAAQRAIDNCSYQYTARERPTQEGRTKNIRSVIR